MLSFLYSPTVTPIPDYWKNQALTRQTFVGKVMSLLFNVITFLPRSKHLLISWLQSPSAVILETPKIKSLTVSIVFPSICCEVMVPDAMIFIFWGSKITADGDCSHEIKRCLLLGRKVLTNLDSILKSRDITLSTKVCLVQDVVFPVVMYGCESWTVKKAEH